MKKLATVGALFLGLVLLTAGFTPAQDKDADVKAAKAALEKKLADLEALKAKAADKGVAADDPPQFKRGARRTPLASVIEALRTGKAAVYHSVEVAPTQIITIPKRISYWGNNQFGICVTSEMCYAFADYSTFVGVDEVFVTEATCISWATQHGVRDGADLLQVIQMMQRDGIKDESGTLRKCGTPSTVDYSSESLLQNAIAVGPVSIAIDANALPSGAGNKSGWIALSGSRHPNTDHCVSLCGYGKLKDLCDALGISVPSGVDPNKVCYLLFTWNTIGIVSHEWIMGTCVEAWLRTPTIIGLAPPPPKPSPVTVAVSDVTATVGQPVTFLPIASGGTGPYKFGFDYGDGSKDGLDTGTHTYAAAGTYAVTVTVADSGGMFGRGACKAVVGSGPTPNPIPGAKSLTLKGFGAEVDREYYILEKALGEMRLVDLLTQQQPSRPMLTPAQRDALRQILDQLGGKK